MTNLISSNIIWSQKTAFVQHSKFNISPHTARNYLFVGNGMLCTFYDPSLTCYYFRFFSYQYLTPFLLEIVYLFRNCMQWPFMTSCSLKWPEFSCTCYYCFSVPEMFDQQHFNSYIYWDNLLMQCNFPSWRKVMNYSLLMEKRFSWYGLELNKYKQETKDQSGNNNWGYQFILVPDYKVNSHKSRVFVTYEKNKNPI